MPEFVVLVNEKDEPQGLMEKQEAHQKGLLHRAFSVFLFNEKGEMLLQKKSGYQIPFAKIMDKRLLLSPQRW